MKVKRKCSSNCSQKKGNGNCMVLGSDKLPVQCVGGWVKDKFYFLESYLNASCKARAKFADNGNAVYIDLFSGPGKCIVRDGKEELTNGALLALSRGEACFNEAYLIDIEQENIDALKQRVDMSVCNVKCDDCNSYCDALINKLRQKKYRYHFAFVDPFAPEALSFDTLRKLATFERMDMLIHFPIGTIKRNYKFWIDNQEETILDAFMGSRAWRDVRNVPPGNIYRFFVDFFIKQLQTIGYPQDGLRYIDNQHFDNNISAVSIKNARNATMYILVLATKHPLGQKLWTSVLKGNRHKQKSLF